MHLKGETQIIKTSRQKKNQKHFYADINSTSTENFLIYSVFFKPGIMTHKWAKT